MERSTKMMNIGKSKIFFRACFAIGCQWLVSQAVARQADERRLPQGDSQLVRQTRQDIEPNGRKINPSSERIRVFWQEFTKEPHPMGSAAQKRYQNQLVKNLRQAGKSVEVRVQRFTVQAPGQPKRAGEKKLALQHGANIIAHVKGSQKCTLIIGGHYDTKFFEQFSFVGANDGGSSTVMMQELVYLISQNRGFFAQSKSSVTRLIDCDLVFVFFDGEEAFLADWNLGESLFGIKDNLYGSRHFANQLRKNSAGKFVWHDKEIQAVIVLDMVGHKEQSLFLTAGSDLKLAELMLAAKDTLKIASVPFAVEDDHAPFAALGLPVLHVIDWTNLKEWHTEKDTLEVVSAEKLAQFIKVFLAFLQNPLP